MTAEENKTLVSQFVNSYTMEDPAVWDKLCAPEHVAHINMLDWSLEQTKQYLKAERVSFPDEIFSIQEMIAEGDKVAVRYTWQGTHKGPYRGIAPTGNKVMLVFQEIHKISNGKIVESWMVVDLSRFYAQLGITPSPTASATK
jgi:predicted ester cyclase